MATLRELKKRLKSTETTGQLAGAMRTVATAKYRKVSAAFASYAPYSAALFGLSSLVPFEKAEAPDEPFAGNEEKKPPLYVLISGNRGLCGGYHHELFAFFAEEVLKKEPGAEIVVCGRMAEEYCREKGIPVRRVFAVPDVPGAAEARGLCDYLLGVFSGGEVSSVSFVHQRFINMLRQTPEIKPFLPPPQQENAGEAEPPETLFIPDRETVMKQLEPLMLSSEVCSVLLGCASGQQAATMMAMRSAYDNANTSCRKLETEINRRRQAEVTTSVLETSSEAGEY
ncbi:MAG: F0F1 ATP synthase subunit gamma [Clostridiales bacterium]|nr:F0F1 ATP synthase subunit gamma [Clostridiales bacterium]